MHLPSSTPFTDAVPDVSRLIGAAYAMSTPLALTSHWHGPTHWRAVARVGAELIAAGNQAHAASVFLFAVWHDTQRLDDDYDPQHGPRAADRLAALNGTYFHLQSDELDLLLTACNMHTHAQSSDHATLGTCYDADRLNLWRCNIWPDPQYLSTENAQDEERIDSCSRRHSVVPSWNELHATYAELDLLSRR